jgi:adenylylsulfate kinase
MRKHLGPELGFSPEDRLENLRRIAMVAGLLTRHGVIVIVAAIAPYRSLRSEIRKGLSPFLEVFVNAPVEVCERRDVKGLYQRYQRGQVKGLTGKDDVYEVPLSPDVECRTDLESVAESTNKILAALNVASVVRAQINQH